MNYLASFVFLLVVHICLTQAQVGKTNLAFNYFTHPQSYGAATDYTENQVWALNSIQTVSWYTNITSQYTIHLWQQSIQQGSATLVTGIFSSGDNSIGQQSFQWSVSTYSTNLQSSNVYYLTLDDPTGVYGFFAHYFNISAVVASTSSATSSTTSSLSISSSSVKTSGTPSSTLTAISNATPSSTDDKANSGDNNLVLPVGLGVGLGVGIPLVLIAGIWVGIKAIGRRRASLSRGSDITRDPKPDLAYPPQGPPSYVANATSSDQVIHEIRTKSPVVAEMDGQRGATELE